MKTPVSIVRCPAYEQSEVDAAVRQACETSSFPEVTGKAVLLKPNILLGAEPDRAACTHPAVLRAAVRFVKSKGASRVLVGESPGFQIGTSAFSKSGLLQAAHEEGAEWVDFTESIRLNNPYGKAVKSFTVARSAVEAEVLVSLAKLKNHTLMYYTGAMKNLFGCVPGLLKPPFHLRFPERDRFGEMITDLNVALRSDFSILDAVVGMEGPGPASGIPRTIGAILASHDPLALDRTACRLIGLDPRFVANLEDALTRGIWISSDDDIEVVGVRPDEIRIPDWKHVPRQGANGFKIPRVFRNLVSARPFFSRTKCVACEACVTICPADALILVPDPEAKTNLSVHADYGKCIRCYCCHEVCPEDAIVVKRMRPLRR